MKPWRIQVAFQGGGAKLCALLAAAEAIQTLENQKKIEVTRVAGTSAGAIVACLFATRRPLSDVRAKLQSRGRKYINMVVPQKGNLKRFWLLATGQPLFDENCLRRVLGELFAVGGEPIVKLKQLTTPTIVTAADILNGGKVTFGTTETPDMRVIDALAHSCALPFIFRTAAPGANLVDGGIVANLPAEELVAHEESLGKVLAISFARDAVPEMPNGQFGYAKALLDTAMNHSMERARARIGDGAVHEIETGITTFDFTGALYRGLGDHYEEVRKKCNQWFEDQLRLLDLAQQPALTAPSISTPRRAQEPEKPTPAPFPEPEITSSAINFIPPPASDADLRNLTKAITSIYVREYHGTPIIWERSALVITLNSLHPHEDARSKMADDLRQVLVFRPGSDKPIGALRLGLVSSGESAVGGMYVHLIEDNDGRPLEATLVPIRSPYGVAKDPFESPRQLLFFFHPPVSRGSDVALPCTLTTLDQMYNTLPKIADGDERVELISDRSESVEVADIVLYVPQNCADLVLAEYRPAGGRPAIAGRPMTAEELRIYGSPPPGFVAMGWRGCGLKPGELLGVRVLPPPSADNHP